MKRAIKKFLTSAGLMALLCVVGALIFTACTDNGGGASGGDNGGGTTHQYVCQNGTAISGTTDTANVNKCDTCDDGYTKSDDYCVAEATMHDYVCANGTKADGKTDTANTNKCKSCESGYLLVNEECEAFSITLDAGTPAINSISINATASHNTMLHWAVYADGTTKDSAADVINDATNGGDGIIARSGSSGVALTGGNATPINIDKLNANTDYVLYAAISSGESMALSSALEFKTMPLGAIVFNTQPAATNIAQTTADIILASNKAANLYWVLYESAQVLSQSQLKAAATGTGGIDRSGDGQTVTALDQQTIQFSTTLDPKEDYFFYALLEDTEDNTNTALSTQHKFNTIGYKYVCENGTPVMGDATTEITNCESCKDYFRKDVDDSCVATVYTCSGGTKDSSTPAADEADIKNADIEKCTACTNTSTDAVHNGACLTVEFTSIALVDGTTSDNATQLAVTASHDATLHWVVYADDTTAPADAATVISDADNDSTVTAADRSGKDGVALEGGTSKTITDIDGLAANTNFDLYAVITVGDISILSGKVEFMTTAAGAPSFNAAPVASGETQTTANIAFTVTDSDDTTLSLYWVLYTSEQTGLDAATLKSDAMGTGGAMRSGSTADTVTAGTEKTLTIGSNTNPLDAKRTYYFYALVEDDASPNNQLLSAVAEFITTGYLYTCPGGTPAEGTSSTPNEVRCAGCPDGEYLHGTGNDAQCLAHGTLKEGYGVLANGVTIVCPISSNPSERYYIDGVSYRRQSKNSIQQAVTTSAATACTTGITDMSFLFQTNLSHTPSAFNIDVRHYDTSSVTNMKGMFQDTAFDHDISHWDVSKVTNMEGMFKNASNFNQDISTWDVTKVANMNAMFQNAALFDQNISDWCTANVTTEPSDFATGTSGSWSTTEKPGWGGSNTDGCPIGFRAQPTVTDGSTSVSGTVTATKNGKFYWIVYDSEQTTLTSADAIKQAITSNQGAARSASAGIDVTADTATAPFTVSPLVGGTGYYLYGALEELSGNKVVSSKVSNEIPFVTECPAGQIVIGNACVTVQAFGVSDNGIITCDGDGTITWPAGTPGIINGDSSTIYYKRTAQQIHDDNSLAATACTTGITDMSGLFQNKTFFNGNISHWDTSSVTDMSFMFNAASAFRRDISNWDVSQVTTMESMFRNAGTHLGGGFNTDIGEWNTISVTNMDDMFRNALHFDQDLSSWCVTDIPTKPSGFDGGTTDSQWSAAERPKWGGGTTAGCPIRFRAQPTVEDGASTSASGSVTATTDGKFYWIVYDSEQTTLTNADAIKTAVTSASNPGVVRSADGGVAVTAETAKPFTISPINAGNTYYLYGVLERTEGTEIASSIASAVETFVTQCPDGQAVSDNPDGTNSCVTIQTFTKDADGIITCDGAGGATWPAGTPGMVAGDDTTIYYKRTAAQITAANAVTSCTTGITDMSNLLRVGGGYNGSSSFNGNISHWDTSDVENMDSMFRGASSFNQNIGAWDVSEVTDMDSMFRGASKFNQNIGTWNVAKVRSMGSMFRGASDFNQNIGEWDTGMVTTMDSMFSSASDFDQNIYKWNTQAVTNMESMFNSASNFDQDISSWCVVNIGTAPTGFDSNADGNWSTAEKPKWGGGTADGCPIRFRAEPTVGDGGTSVSASVTATTDGKLYWIVYDSSQTAFASSNALKSAIASTNSAIVSRSSGTGVSVTAENPQSFTIGSLSTNSTYFLYTALERESNGSVASSVLSDEESFATECDTGFTEINGVCTEILVFTLHQNGKTIICDTDSDGNTIANGAIGQVTGDETNTIYTKRTAAQIKADNSLAATACTSGITNMDALFTNKGNFNADISHWDVSKVTTMNNMFASAKKFNQDIRHWDVSSVTTMSNMFGDADAFNQPIGNWDVSSVTNMISMFASFGSPKFVQDISGWCVQPNFNDKPMFFDDGANANWDIDHKPQFTASTNVASCP